jgi:hypothetical protein
VRVAEVADESHRCRGYFPDAPQRAEDGDHVQSIEEVTRNVPSTIWSINRCRNNADATFDCIVAPTVQLRRP